MSAREWTAARVFLVVAGTYLTLVGVVGFTLDASFPTSAEAVSESRAYIFGILETNGWHNLAALLTGMPSLAVAWWRPDAAPAFALLVGVLNAVVFVSFEAWGGETFWVASNGADQVVHAATAVGGIATGLWSRRRPADVTAPVG